MKDLNVFLKKQKNKKRQYAYEQYRNLSEDEKNKNRQYGREGYKNLLQDEKQRLVEYRKNYSKMQKIKTGWFFLNEYIKLFFEFLTWLDQVTQ